MLKNTPQTNYSLQNFLYLRKIFHFAGIVFPLFWAIDPLQGAWGLSDATRSFLFVLILSVLIFQIIFEYLRFHFPLWQKIFVMTVGRLLKQNETERINGSLPYFFAVLLLLLFVQREIAIVSMIFLIVGDPSAAYIGSRWGYWRFSNGKSFQGMLGGIIAAQAGGLLFLWVHSLRHSEFLFFSQVDVLASIFILFAGAILAFAVELISGEGIMDDNFTIPLSAAVSMTFSFWLLHFCMGGNWVHSLFFLPKYLFVPV